MSNQINLTVTGVDLGSSAVKIAAVLKGGVQIITNQANFRQTPNVVGYGQKQRLIGEAGQVKIKSNHSNTVIAPSRLLGFNKSCSYLTEQLKFSPARPQKLQSDEQGLKFSLMCGRQKQSFAPEQLVAAYLTQIQKIIGYTNSLSNKNMVISIPTYFTQHERQSLFDAVQIAKKKMNCEYSTQLVNQQIAISMDYGFPKRNDFSEDLQKAKKILFIDFGHSKASAFVTAFNRQHMKIEAMTFQRQLGCKFMDQQMVKFYAAKFDQSHPNMQLNLLESKKSVLKLVQNVEKQRKVLSGNFEHDLSIQCIMEDEDIYYLMKRDEYEKICAPVIQKFKKLLKDFAASLKQKGIKYEAIELIGGGTRIPSIIKAISEVFGEEPSRTINSNQCVARGAALISAMNSSIFKVQPYLFFTISPYIINLQINNEKLDKKLVQINQLLLKNKTISFQVNKSLQTFRVQAVYQNIDNGLQPRIFQCQIQLQQKDKSSENKPSQMKEETEQNQKVSLSLTINFDQNGFVALENIVSNDSSFIVKYSKLNYFPKFTTEQLNKMEQKQKNMTINDLKMKKFYEKRNQFQAQIYKIKHNIETFISENSDYISEQKKNQLKNLVETEQNWLNSHTEGDSDIKTEDFNKRSQQINKKTNQVLQSVSQLKQSHATVNTELQKLANFLNEIINKRKQNEYPDQVNKAGQWINQIFKRQENQSKCNLPVVTVQQLNSVYQGVVQKLNQYDRQMERQRQANLRKRQQPRNYDHQYEKPNSTFNPYGGYGRPSYTQGSYNPHTTRNKKNPYSSNQSPFGSFFGNSGFF